MLQYRHYDNGYFKNMNVLIIQCWKEKLLNQDLVFLKFKIDSKNY